MRAITIWQPWCSLILIGAKPYEFRSSPYTRYVNPPKVGERIALQAGARPVRRKEVVDLIERLEQDDPEVNPCLYRDIALPFLKRVLAGLAHPRRRVVRTAAAVAAPLFDLDVGPTVPPALAEEMGIKPFVCPLSAVLCTAVLGEPTRGDICAREFGRAHGLYIPTGAGAAFNWGWPLVHVRPVMPPIEAHGVQGFWEWRGGEAAAA